MTKNRTVTKTYNLIYTSSKLLFLNNLFILLIFLYSTLERDEAISILTNKSSVEWLQLRYNRERLFPFLKKGSAELWRQWLRTTKMSIFVLIDSYVVYKLKDNFKVSDDSKTLCINRIVFSLGENHIYGKFCRFQNDKIHTTIDT